ncbi:MAG: purine/pyrimidine permease, partial [Chloroflexota bacterium]|nr:purine/pyrimidine permease [Chloroflexota bacterium]
TVQDRRGPAAGGRPADGREADRSEHPERDDHPAGGVALVARTGDRLGPGAIGLYALQWVLIAFYAAALGIAIVGVGLGLEGDALAGYMGRVVLMIGLATLAQTVAGHRWAMLSGPNIIPSLAIVAASEAGGRDYALQSFNASIVGGLVVGVLALLGWIRHIRVVWTPLVLGSVVVMIGLIVAPFGMALIAESGFGRPFWTGIGLALLIGVLSIRARGFVASAAIGLSIVGGYAIFIAGGDLDWAEVTAMPTILPPTVFPYGLAAPPLDLVLVMTAIALFSVLNLYGNLDAFGGLIGERLEPRRTDASFTVFGFVENCLAGVLGVPGHVAYGENLGIVALSRVASRSPIIVAAAVIVLLGFFGLTAGLMATMPRWLAGAVLLGVAANLIGIGAASWRQLLEFGQREQFIVGFSIFFTLGLYLLPSSAFEGVPRIVHTLVKNPVVFVIFVVIALEQVLFRRSRQAQGSAPS